MDISIDTVVEIEKLIILIASTHNIILLLNAIYKNNKSLELSSDHILSKSLYTITILTLLSFITLNITSILTMFAQYYEYFINCKYLDIIYQDFFYGIIVLFD